MKLLSEILVGVVDVPTSEDRQISGVSEHSAYVEEGDLYIALGDVSYCQEAINKGAAAIIGPLGSEVSKQYSNSAIAIIESQNINNYVDVIIDRLYAGATKQMDTIAITGTDGKSSVAHLVAQALEQTATPCGLIGTLGYGRLQDLSGATHTTPPKSMLAKEYSKLYEMGCKFVSLEASSHGIHQNRLRNLSIHTAVLTNITRDHLDYHKSIEAYKQAKAALFFDHQAKYAVVNIDDQTGNAWCDQLSDLLNVVSYSLTNSSADIYAEYVEYQPSSIVLKLSVRGHTIEVHTTLLGEFNVLNILAVAAVLVCLKKSNNQIALALNKLDAVPGRMQNVVSEKEFNVIVDYAHTPAALFAALVAVRQHCHGRVICVFGCGGDRDTGKRPQMGEVATHNSDCVIITSDNPRQESPQAILEQILQGCSARQNFISIIDRRSAIAYALSVAEKHDAVLIAGKGHEKYQYINGQAIEFDDVEVVKNELRRIAHG